VAATELLADLAGRGFVLAREGDGIRVTPASRLTDADRKLIRDHKPELLAAIAVPPPVAAPPQHPQPVYLPCSRPSAICWACCNRPCEVCGKATGSAFIRRCVSCGELPDAEGKRI
jgi:hypothetical protein